MTLNDILAQVRTAVHEAKRSARRARQERQRASEIPRFESLETKALLSTTSPTDPPTDFVVINKPAATASPSETVTGNGTKIQSGSSTPSTTNDTDWGTVAQNATAVSHTFTITNIGTENLGIGDITVPVGFKLTNPPATNIQSDIATTFTIEFASDTPGTYAGTVTIPLTNDPVRSEFTFAIKGKVLVDQNVFEPDNVSSQAHDIPTDGTFQIAALANRFDIDWYKFTPTTTPQLVTITLASEAGNGLPQISLWGPDDATIAIGNIVAASGSTISVAVINASDLIQDSTYFIKVEANNAAAATTQYSINVQVSNQELNVLGLNSTQIFDGQTKTNTTDGTDFGTVDPNTTPTRTFTLTNNGSASVKLDNVKITGSTKFKISSPPDLTILAGASTTIVVSLDTTTLGAFTGTVSFGVSDPSIVSPFTFAVTGLVQYIPPVLQFSSPIYSAPQTDGTAFVVVTRTGSLRDTLTVDLNSSDASATAGIDYLPVSQHMTFSPGISSISVDVSFLQSSSPSPLFFTLTLSNAAGTNVTIGPANTTTVSIIVIPPSDNSSLVNAIYNDLLGRDADPDGLDLFTGNLDAARNSTRTAVVTAVLNSNEHLTQLVGRNGGSIFSLLLHRTPSDAELTSFVNSLALGVTREDIIALIIGSPEYFSINGSTNLSFVSAVYRDLLSRSIDTAGLVYVDNLDTGLHDRRGIANLVIFTPEYRTGVIQNTYHDALQRTASAAEITFWLDRYVSQESLMSRIMGSAEAFRTNGNTVPSWLNYVYNSLLGRNVDSGAVVSFSAQIADGYTSARQTFISIITGSPEYKTHSVTAYYTSFLGRSASAAELTMWTNDPRNAQQIQAVILGSLEYFNHTGGTNQSFVNQLYIDVLARPVDPFGNAVVAQLNAGTTSRDTVVNSLLQSTERSSNIIVTAYTVFLARTPSQGEINYWLGQTQSPEDTFIKIGSSTEAFLHLSGVI